MPRLNSFRLPVPCVRSFGFGCPAPREPLQQRAQAPVPRRSRRKRFPADRGQDVIARGEGDDLGGAQSRRQGRSDHLAERAVVVTAAEFRQGKPLARERRHISQDLLGRAQPGIGYPGFRRYVPDHADHALFSERNEHPVADVRAGRVLRTVIEQGRQRHIESDAQDRHRDGLEYVGVLFK